MKWYITKSTSQKHLKTWSAEMNSCILEVRKMIRRIEFRASSTCGSSPRTLLARASRFLGCPATKSPMHCNAYIYEKNFRVNLNIHNNEFVLQKGREQQTRTAVSFWLTEYYSLLNLNSMTKIS